MHSYHVHFSANEGTSVGELVAHIHVFMQRQVGSNYAKHYRLINFTDKASFPELPDFHLIVDYETDADLKKAFAIMQNTYQEEPHRSLMGMVTGFRVAFSIDKEPTVGVPIFKDP